MDKIEIRLIVNENHTTLHQHFTMATSSSDPWMFQDTSTECAICLERLDNEDYGLSQGESSDKSTIRLACGHRWHLQCLKEQLELARPTSTKRLLFSGCQCAKCGTICEHEALEDYTRTTDALRQKVDVLLERQLNNDAASLDYTKRNHDNDGDAANKSRLLLAWEKVKDSVNAEAKEQVLREARRKYAFYLCSHCHEPYFGGTVECSDGMVEDEGAADNEPRLCMACTPQVVCRNPLEHLGSIVWKCRYCCQPATHVCYGNVHFCDACHDRNTERVRQLQSWKRDERLARRSGERFKSAGPPQLEPIACPGIDCPFPKPLSSRGDTGNSTSGSAECHSNGPTPNCEQVYTCLLCQSASSSASASAEEQPGSHNLVTNPSGQLGLQGWRQLNRRRWQVEESEWPVNGQTTTNFVSSFEPCVMVQIIDLQQVVPNLLAQYGEGSFRSNDFAVQVSARYQARTDCPSVFQLTAIAMGRNQREVARLQTDVLDAPPDHWAKAELVFEHLSLERVNYVAIMVTGKDQRFWQGNFGSKVADCSIRILWDENNANVNEGRIRNAVFERNVNEAYVNNRGVQHERNPRGLQVHDVRPQQQEYKRNWLLFDLILPVLCFVILGWLTK